MKVIWNVYDIWIVEPDITNIFDIYNIQVWWQYMYHQTEQSSLQIMVQVNPAISQTNDDTCPCAPLKSNFSHIWIILH